MIPFTIDELTPAEEQLAWAMYLKNAARAAPKPASRPQFSHYSRRNLPPSFLPFGITFPAEGAGGNAARAGQELK